MPFKSKKQWRWAFATRKTWAERWAKQTRSYKSLPTRKRGSGGQRRTRAR